MTDLDYRSCLVSHLQSYLELAPSELRLIEEIEAEQSEYDANARIQARGQPSHQFYVVKRGWLFTSIDLVDGRRHILQIHHPGDIVGIENAPFTHATSDLTSLEHCVLCPFHRRGLGMIMDREPRLGSLIVSVTARDQVIANDLKRATARYSASDRILLLLLLLLHRLRVTNIDIDDTIRLPMNQTHLGDIVGLTNVSVSKAMGDLEQDGWIARTPSTVTLHRIDEAVERLDFQDRYAKIDTSWFPAPRDSG